MPGLFEFPPQTPEDPYAMFPEAHGASNPWAFFSSFGPPTSLGGQTTATSEETTAETPPADGATTTAV